MSRQWFASGAAVNENATAYLFAGGSGFGLKSIAPAVFVLNLMQVKSMFKNTAGQKFRVFAYDVSTGLPKSGDAANITAYISKDFGVVTQLADTSATEDSAANASGYYLFDAAQVETNADDILVSGKSTTTNIVVLGAPPRISTVLATAGDQLANPVPGNYAAGTAGFTIDKINGLLTASSPPSSPVVSPSAVGFTTGYVTCFDATGTPEPGVTITCHAAFYGSSVTGASIDTAARTAVSASNGLAQFTNLILGLNYTFQRGTGPAITVQIPMTAGPSYALPAILGTP